ncbi:universal stress protein [Streptomyces sp. NPDC005931]|uniref:universal stress protein n=1 Tax=Streptomyces sp. NPDC005931 TaxID=3364737 RepID=UPI003693B619
MQGNVAVGVDGSPAGFAAAHWAAHEAVHRGTGLDVVHAWHPQARPASGAVSAGTGRDAAEQALRAAVHSVRAAYPGLPVTEQLVQQAPVTALVTAAARSELLVLGSLGLGRVSGFVTGSVSQRVVARAARPVVLVRAGRGAADEHLPATDGVAPEEIARTPYRSVVLGLDLGHPCDELIAFAFDAAGRRSTGLHVVHTFRMPQQPSFDSSTVMAPAVPPVPVASPEALASVEHAVVAALRPWCEKYPDVRVTETVTTGRAAPALVWAAREAGLLVVGRRTVGSGPGAHAGPVTHAVLHHVACPVAVVPHD